MKKKGIIMLVPTIIILIVKVTIMMRVKSSKVTVGAKVISNNIGNSKS